MHCFERESGVVSKVVATSRGDFYLRGYVFHGKFNVLGVKETSEKEDQINVIIGWSDPAWVI